MKFSLLEKQKDEYAYCGILYDLSIDRALERISDDTRRNDFFLDILSKPLTSRENIIYRQEIFRDLNECQGLLDALKLLFTRYDKIKNDWQEMRLSSSVPPEASAEAFLEYSYASLKITAIFPSTIASFFKNLNDTLSEYDIRSEAFLNMKEWCCKMNSNSALDRIVEISQLFRYGEIEDFDFLISVKADEILRTASNEILLVEKRSKEQTGLSRLFKKEKKTDRRIKVENNVSDSSNDPDSNAVGILGDSLSSIDRALTDITEQMYDIFYGLSSELMFYETGLKYIGSAEKQGVFLCYPVILPENEDIVDITGVKDFLLLSQNLGDKTIPNDIALDGSNAGLVVKGLTDSGKTVFLRAVGTALLFAQAGLPILAESCRVSLREGFFSHFSSAEENFLMGSAQGRFDQEAGEISAIIDRFRPYSFLLLNETFQTTSYSEGTESIYHILRYMPQFGAKYIFVTHLTQLFNYMKDENVILAHTSESPENKYKIIINGKD